jgi:hypothetical protein
MTNQLVSCHCTFIYVGNSNHGESDNDVIGQDGEAANDATLSSVHK